MEVAASSVSHDLGDKLAVYRRNGVREYVVWRVLDHGIDWFELAGGALSRPPGGCRRRLCAAWRSLACG